MRHEHEGTPLVPLFKSSSAVNAPVYVGIVGAAGEAHANVAAASTDQDSLAIASPVFIGRFRRY
jgi:hypothetical protein